jgi:hypothetical protein
LVTEQGGRHLEKQRIRLCGVDILYRRSMQLNTSILNVMLYFVRNKGRNARALKKRKGMVTIRIR